MKNKLWRKPDSQIIPRTILSEDRLAKHSAKCLVWSGEIPSPRQTSIDKTNDGVMHSERVARQGLLPNLGSPCLNSGPWHVAGAGQAKDKAYIFPLVCTKQTTKVLDLSRMANIIIFSGLAEEHRKLSERTRPQDLGFTCYFEAAIYIRWACPTPKRVARGLGLYRNQRSIVPLADLLAACWHFYIAREKKMHRVENKRKHSCCFLFPHTGGTNVYWAACSTSYSSLGLT